MEHNKQNLSDDRQGPVYLTERQKRKKIFLCIPSLITIILSNLHTVSNMCAEKIGRKGRTRAH